MDSASQEENKRLRSSRYGFAFSRRRPSPSLPGLTRLRGRSPFGAARARQSILLRKSVCQFRRMPGSSLGMTSVAASASRTKTCTCTLATPNARVFLSLSLKSRGRRERRVDQPHPRPHVRIKSASTGARHQHTIRPSHAPNVRGVCRV
jgi:hypothetical protein